MNFLSKYILFTTIAALFSEAARYQSGIDIKLFYLILGQNFLLFLFGSKLRFSYKHIFIIAGLLFLAICTSFLLDSPIKAAVSQIIGISITTIYFYNFFRYIKLPPSEVFKYFSRIAFYVSVLGVIIFFWDFIQKGRFIRLHSIMLEPAHYSMVTLPAFFYYFNNKNNKIKSFILGLAIILSSSSVGFLGLAICIMLYIKKRFIIITAILLVAFFQTMYFTSENFRFRIDDTVLAIKTLSVSGVNLSTYAIITNSYVAIKSFEDSPLIGHGLGSHETSYYKHINKLHGVNKDNKIFFGINAADANSLFLRVLSDFGLFGILCVFFYIIYYYSKKDLKNQIPNIISNSCLVYFSLKLLREGHYFSPEMYFFFFMYIFIYKETKEKRLTNCLK
ncbi:MAG: O-antigen ligase family protein [Fibrobacterales bacterium]